MGAAPSSTGWARATASIGGPMSTPVTAPVAPARCAAMRATTPVPHATSSTRSPAATPTSPISRCANGSNIAGTRNDWYISGPLPVWADQSIVLLMSVTTSSSGCCADRTPATLRAMDARIAHVAVNADDLAVTQRFYEGVFGWRFEQYAPGFVRTELSDGRTFCAIQERRQLGAHPVHGMEVTF